MGIMYGWLPPRSRNKTKKHTAFVPLKATAISPRMAEHRAQMAKMPSRGDAVGVATVARRATYQDETLATREEAARNVKHTVAPICNKGGYQLITGSDVKTMGRKV